MTDDCYNLVEYTDNSTFTGIKTLDLWASNIPNITGITAPATNIAGIEFGTASGSNNTWTAQLCCLYENSKIQIPGGYKFIKDIRAGDKVIDIDGNEIQVLYNIKHLLKTGKFISISRSTLGLNQPSEDLLITEGHPIIHQNRSYLPEDLLNGNTIKHINVKPGFVYTLCTEKKSWVMTNNVPTETYSKKSWKNFCSNHPTVWEKQ